MAEGAPSSGRALWAGFQLLDRQLVDREGRLCGMVDDLELTRAEETGDVYVSAILSGPGALATRLGASRLGTWLRQVTPLVAGEEGDPVRIPFGLVTDIGDHISLALDAEETGTAGAERWVRRHVIAHIPGSRHDPE